MIKRCTSILLSLYAMNSFALLCPNNFNHIDFGQTMDQIVQQCGKAANVKESTVTIDHSPQEWAYYIAPPPTPGLQKAGTLKAVFSFSADGKLLNIAINGIGLADTNICGQNLQIGSTQTAVKAACGDAPAISKQSNGNNPAVVQQVKVTEMLYSSNPPKTLHFEDGALKSIN